MLQFFFVFTGRELHWTISSTSGGTPDLSQDENADNVVSRHADEHSGNTQTEALLPKRPNNGNVGRSIGSSPRSSCYSLYIGTTIDDPVGRSACHCSHAGDHPEMMGSGKA